MSATITARAGSGEPTRVRVLATSDLHMTLRGFDHYVDTVSDGVGLTRLATLIHQARAEAPGAVTLLLDNGDSLQGTPMDTPALTEARHPLMHAFGLLGYDAIGLGNHDFNFGLEVLDLVLADAPCPVLCSNARRSDGGAFAARPGVIVTRDTQRGPLRIGVLSVLPPQTAMWDAEILQGRLSVEDMVPAAARAAAELRAQGADLVIALAHTGVGEDRAVPGQENALVPLAAVPGIDALIGGHTHLLLPDRRGAEGGALFQGKPVAMPGAGGSHLAVIDLSLERDGADDDRGGRWRVTRAESHLRAACGIAEDPEVLAVSDPVHARTRQMLTRPVGHSPWALHSYFALVAPCAALAVVAHAQAAAIRATGRCALPLLSAVAPGKTGGRGGPMNFTDVPPGMLTARHVADLCVFPNVVCAVEIDGAGLADWLEMSVSLYNRVAAGGGEQPLIDPAWSGHGFDVIYGLTYQIDLTRPARFNPDGSLADAEARRVGDLRHEGRPVGPADRFLVATNTYRANGGGHVAALEGLPRLQSDGSTLRHALEDSLARGCLPPDPFARVFRFAPLPGARVRLDTGAGAGAHLAELARHDPLLCPDGKTGFAALSLTL